MFGFLLLLVWYSYILHISALLDVHLAEILFHSAGIFCNYFTISVAQNTHDPLNELDKFQEIPAYQVWESYKV